MSDMQVYEFLVAPPTPANRPAPARIKIQIHARNYFEAKEQAEAIYGKDCARSPIVPKK